MAKKGNKTIDENFMKEIISQGLPIKQEDVSVKERTILTNTKTRLTNCIRKKWRNYYDTQIDYYPCHTLLFAFITLVWKKPKGYKTNK